jgi:hypothetical protein
MLHLPALVTGKIILALIGLLVVAQPIQMPPQKIYEEVIQMYYVKVLNSDNCVLESKKVTENTFTKAGEWTEYTVREGDNGWIIEGVSRIQGNRTGYKVIVPFDKSLYKKGQDLNAEHNDFMTVAEYIQGAEYSLGKVLRKGHVVE